MSADALLPVFGHELLELRMCGRVPVPPRVVIALDYACGRAHVLVPADLDPELLDFRFVAGLDAWLRWAPHVTPKARCDATLRALRRCLPRRLVLIEHRGGVLGVQVSRGGAA
jgi:hypothetical protein